jgi:hypothetical protein
MQVTTKHSGNRHTAQRQRKDVQQNDPNALNTDQVKLCKESAQNSDQQLRVESSNPDPACQRTP